MRKMNSQIHEHGLLQPNSMTNANSSSIGDIYYEFTERDKYRSVHPPQNAAHQYHDYRDSLYVGSSDPRYDHAGRPHREHEKISAQDKVSHVNYQNEPGHNADSSVNSGKLFEIASAADCYDTQNRWPLSSNSIRSNSSASYNDFPLSDAPKCVCATHFNVDGRNWSSIKDIISQFLTNFQGMTWEYKDLDHLWVCDYLNGPRQADCFLQIRAYLDPIAGCVLIEMQKLRGDDSSFYQLYHSLLNEICSNPRPPSTRLEDPSILSASSHEVETDCNIEFFLVPVLEMIQSDYRDMQEEALRLTCELSANVKSEYSVCPEIKMNGFAGESTRAQMLQLGYLVTLIDLVCKCFAEDSNGVVNDLGPLLAGHRALVGIYNLSTERERFSQTISGMQNSEKFRRLLDRISKVGVFGHSHSSQIQQMCSEMIKISY
jgi:hypothetical protein